MVQPLLELAVAEVVKNKADKVLHLITEEELVEVV